jgi:hypothetical protein
MKNNSENRTDLRRKSAFIQLKEIQNFYNSKEYQHKNTDCLFTSADYFSIQTVPDYI